MNESYKEQHPLLCDDLSDVEHFNYNHYQRRLRPMVYRSRSSYKARAASAIITQWPNHWSSAVTYWWIGIGMTVLTILIIYNSIVAFTLFPVTDTKPSRHEEVQVKFQNSTLPDIFMHIFVDMNEDVDMTKYLPYVETLSAEYPDFKYNIFVVVNDTDIEASTLSAAKHNKIALKTIMSEDSSYSNKDGAKKLSVKYTNLSQIMNRSAVKKKKWENLPKQFTEFLVRAISIWEDGGIVFNPMLFSSHSLHKRYIDKLRNILEVYRKCKESNTTHVNKSNHHERNNKTRKKVNNIRDIIEILEHDGDPYDGSQTNLTEAENKISEVTSNNRKLLSIPSSKVLKNCTEDKNLANKDAAIHVTKSPNATLMKSSYKYKYNETTNINKDSSSDLDPQSLNNNKTNKFSLLPLFLDFIFHDKVKIETLQEKYDQKVERKRKSIIPRSGVKDNSTFIVIETTDKSSDVSEDKHKPLVPKTNGQSNDAIEYKSDLPHKCPNKEQLTIDLNGNILATEASCHAFLGIIFSNIDHHIEEEESVNSVIIAELTIFCKGNLSSCKGINLIVL